jgi:hypothetical protein
VDGAHRLRLIMTDTRGSSLLHVAFLLKALFVSFSGRVQFVHGEIMHGARRSHMHEATCHGETDTSEVDFLTDRYDCNLSCTYVSC